MSTKRTAKREQLVEYLRNQAENGEYYCKSKFIAEDLGLSAKEVGVMMSQLEHSAADLEIEQWANARATTWRIQI